MLKLDRSVSLIVWWAALHGLLAAAALAAGLPGLTSALAMIALCAHAWLRYPERHSLLLYSGGRFALPEAAEFNLVLGPATRYSTWWVHLELETDRSRRRLLVLKDQLCREDWRRLQVTLREHEACASVRRP